ncbi:hypothetical protein BaRGS_00018000, partial [Batillaria attramentaria]
MENLNIVAVVVLLSACVSRNSVVSLCHNLEATCLERGTDTFNRFPPETNDTSILDHRHCEVLLTLLECVEDFICTCNITLTQEVQSLFDQSYTEYHDYCRSAIQVTDIVAYTDHFSDPYAVSQVTAHEIREDGDIRCYRTDSSTSQQNGTHPATNPAKPTANEDPQTNLEIGEAVQLAKLEELDARILKECPEYKHCSEVYFEDLQRVYDLPQHIQLPSRCTVSRYNLVCISDSFCTCGHADNALIIGAMKNILALHEAECSESLYTLIYGGGDSGAANFPFLFWCAVMAPHVMGDDHLALISSYPASHPHSDAHALTPSGSRGLTQGVTGMVATGRETFPVDCLVHEVCVTG